MATLPEHGKKLESIGRNFPPVRYHVAISDQDDREVFADVLPPRLYSTGSMGWMTAGKFELGDGSGRKVQVNVQLVVIGSKPGSDKGPERT